MHDLNQVPQNHLFSVHLPECCRNTFFSSAGGRAHESHLKPIDLKTQTHPLRYKPLECKFMVGAQNSLCGELFMSSESDFGSHNYDFSISAALFLVFSLCVLSRIVEKR